MPRCVCLFGRKGGNICYSGSFCIVEFSEIQGISTLTKQVESCLQVDKWFALFLFYYVFPVSLLFPFFRFLLHVMFNLLLLYLPGAKSSGNMCTLGLANGIRFKRFNHDP